MIIWSAGGSMLENITSLLILLNPFALYIYLDNVIDELSFKDFIVVLFKASLISAVIYTIFAFSGNFIFNNILNIRFESFRMFGGIIIFTYAFIFIVKGERSYITLKGSLDDLASEIALPFMVGAASVSLVVVMGEKYSKILTLQIITFSLLANFLVILLLAAIKSTIAKKKFKVAYDKFMTIFLRINGFFVGAIGIDMFITGLENVI